MNTCCPDYTQEGKPLVLNVVRKAEAALARDPSANKVSPLCSGRKKSAARRARATAYLVHT